MTWNARFLSGRSTQSLWSHHQEIAEEEEAILADKQAEIAKQKKDAAFQLKQFVIKPPSQLLMTRVKTNQCFQVPEQSSLPESVCQKFPEPDCVLV